ncbi:zinc finger protein 521-like [Metopolophium dirhodum]|uniref:zinc finger protein 521-like n=1 Tax=Metopolophium dirhodum TaxID=44670 RepID=UPI002990396D|nr:zinc finger protein 521-like [Metopolophium dirhodum]
MTSMNDYIKVEITGDADAVSSELYVENTIENPTWYTVEDNHVSLISENVEKVIKVETDMLDDCMWESRIEITKDVANQSKMDLPLECQDVADNNIFVNHENISDKIFHCNICGKSFVLNYLLKNHLAEHKKQVNYKINKCKFCKKQFKLKFGLNRHIQKHHNSMHKYSKYIEHKKYHERSDQTKFDTIPNIKLCKSNGVWKSKTNEFKCNICFQKCYNEKNLAEHMETHDNCQIQCNDCLDYVSVSELNNHMENIHNKHLFKCQKCNQQFPKQRHLNCHLIHCLRSSNKICDQIEAIEKTCSACGMVFNNSLSLTNHTTIGCKHYTCKYCGQFFNTRNFWLKHTDVHKKVEQCAMLKESTGKTSTVREYNQTEVVNDPSFNTNGRQSLSRCVTGIYSPDHTRLVNSSSTIVSTTPNNSMPNNYIIPNPRKTNILEKNSSEQACLVNSATIVSTAPHTYIPNNNIISKPGQTEILLNTLDRNSSDQIGVGSGNSTIVSTTPMASQPSMQPYSENLPSLSNTLERNSSTQIEYQLGRRNVFPEPMVHTSPVDLLANRIKIIKQEEFFHNTVREHIQRQKIIQQSNELRQQSSMSISPHNSIANNNSPVVSIKQETDSLEQNLANSNESIVSTASQNSMRNNFNFLNIKQEKTLCTNVRESNSSDQEDSVNSNESTSANVPRDLMIEPNPINIGNNNIVSTVRETPYFCIRKLPNIKNRFCHNDQTSQDNVIFICRICKNSPSIDIHSFALHMSDHSECNMHECIVCDKTFNSVILWKDHMTYHQQQIDLNVSTIQFNHIETESNALDLIKSRNTEPQVFKNLRNRKSEISLSDDSHSDTTRLNSANKIKYQYDCSTLKKVLPSTSALKDHQTLHSKSQPFSCRYCDKKFSGKGPCTNHEKSHINSHNFLLQNNENIKLEPIVIQNSISIEDNNSDSEPMARKQYKKNKSINQSSIKKTNFCNLCNRKFTKRCYFTNHMLMKHKINPNIPKQLTSIDYDESIILSENIELTNEYENKLSVPENYKNNNLNNHVNKSNEKKSTFCMFCNTHFAHPGALTNHMRIHGCKTYNCQYCHMQFSRKGLYIMHEKTHVLKNVVKSAPIQNKNNIVVEVNDELQIEHYNNSEIIHSPVDSNSSGTNLMDIEHLWFPCDVCEKKFSTPFQLNVHRKSHSEIVPYVCKICNRTYQLKFRWNWHLKGHYQKHYANLKSKQHTNKLKIESISHKDKIKCRYCKKEYNSISQWKKHMTMSKECRRHCKSNLPEFTSNKATKNSTKSGRFRCNICMKTYSTSYNRTVHKKNVHKVLDSTYLNTYDDTGLQKEKLIDKIQQKPVIKKRNRRNHINGTKCELCGKTYSNGANLSRHISIIHTQTFEPMTCNVCGSTFKHKYSYREHLKIKHKQLFKHYEETNSTYKKTRRQIISVNKTNIMKYFCKICKMKFADNITLQEHSKIHTLNTYKCNDCGQQFETNLTLGTHILENHSAGISTSNKNEHVENYERQNTSLEIMSNNFVQCEICLKILKTPKYLRLHMRLHTGVKPFKCDKCNKAFRFKSNLKVHQKKDLACYTS